MKKIVNPCMCKTFRDVSPAYAKIEYENGRLSISGVIGPTGSGNCKGSAGQCVDDIRKGEPTEDWNSDMLQKFCDIWDRWHLNDMRPYCPHMKELGWAEQAQEKVKVVKWTATRQAMDKAKEAEKRAISCLKSGATFVPTQDETMYANVSYHVVTYGDELPEHPEFYEFKESDCLGHSNMTYEARGHIQHTEHGLGLLGKKCPTCGYGYGTAWLREDVPQDVLDWLFALPDTRRRPAWV